jgi:hypothetical protein
MRVLASWIEGRYALFCASLGVRWPPPYKDFAKELAEEMDRKRHDMRRNGKRETYTTYRVPDPNEAVVVTPALPERPPRLGPYPARAQWSAELALDQA